MGNWFSDNENPKPAKPAPKKSTRLVQGRGPYGQAVEVDDEGKPFERNNFTGTDAQGRKVVKGIIIEEKKPKPAATNTFKK